MTADRKARACELRTQWGRMWDGVLRVPDTWSGLHGCLSAPLRVCKSPTAKLCVFNTSPHKAQPKAGANKGLPGEPTPKRTCSPDPEVQQGGSSRKSYLIPPKNPLMKFVAPLGGRSRKDKGILEGGRRGRLHNWKISHGVQISSYF